MAATDYVNMIRVNLAAEMLGGSDLAVEEIAERAGFSSARHMRRVWSGFHNEPPAGSGAARANSSTHFLPHRVYAGPLMDIGEMFNDSAAGPGIWLGEEKCLS